MGVRPAIDELRSSLEHIIAAEELLKLISGRLSELRRSFPSHRSSFTPDDILLLKSLREVSDRLRAFIEIKEELPGVDSLREYERVVGRLIRIKDALGCMAVACGQRDPGAQRTLPDIRKHASTQREVRRTSRIFELHQNPGCVHADIRW